MTDHTMFCPSLKNAIKTFFLCLVVMSVSACSLLSSEDSGPVPSPLPEIDSTVTISELWSQNTGNGQGDIWLTLQPAVFGNTIYTASHSGEVSAFDLADGKKRWSVMLDTQLTGGVAVQDNTIVLGTASGKVITLDANNGHAGWSASVSGEILSAPAISGDIVAVQSIDGKITAFNRQTGDRLWQQSTTPPILLLRGSASPVIYHQRIYAGFANGDLIAWNAETGQQLWQTTIALPEGNSELARMVDVDATPVIMGSRLYAISYQGNLKALNPSDGQTLWTRKASSYQGMAMGAGSIYISSADSHLSAIDPSSGATLWNQGKLAYRQLSAPQVYQSYVLAGDSEGYLHVLSQADGSFVGRYHLASSGIRVQPLVIGSRVYVFTDHGRLVALDIRKK